MTIIYAILMLCMLIFIHEFGHFIAAKACGVKVNEFALGMGPVLVQKQKGDTMYSLRAIPIGGFCAMEGEDEESTHDDAFCNKKPWQKAVILIAGSFMNLIAAIILMIAVTFCIGSPTNTIGDVTKGSPAERAGILAGDKIIEISDYKVDDWYSLSDAIDKFKEGEKMEIVVDRDGQEYNFSVAPEKIDGKVIIGVGAAYEKNIGRAIVDGPKATWNMTKMMYSTIKQLITGDVAAKDLSGVVGIVYMVDQSISQGLITFLYFMALLSLNLAVMNMLPFPALDGGRLLFVIIRKVTGKAITDNMEAVVHMIGMLLLIALMIYVTWQDILRFILPIFN